MGNFFEKPFGNIFKSSDLNLDKIWTKNQETEKWAAIAAATYFGGGALGLWGNGAGAAGAGAGAASPWLTYGLPIGISTISSYLNSRANIKSIDRAADMSWEQFQQQMELQKPFYESEKRLLPEKERIAKESYKLWDDMVKWGKDTNLSPLAKMRLEESSKEIDKMLASRGEFGSGAGLELHQKNINRIMAEEEANKKDILMSLLGGGQTLSRPETGSTDFMSRLRGDYAGKAGALEIGRGDVRGKFFSDIGDIGMGAVSGYQKNRGYEDILKKLREGDDPYGWNKYKDQYFVK